MGSCSPEFYLQRCDNPDCHGLHPSAHRISEMEKSEERGGLLSQLPNGNFAWVAVKFGGALIFTNQEYPACVLMPDGELHVLLKQLPTACARVQK